MATANGLFVGVRKEIARMWKVKDVGVQSEVKPLNFRKTAVINEKETHKSAAKQNSKTASGLTSAKSHSFTDSTVEKNRRVGSTDVGENILIEGSIKASEDMHIDGTVHGTIEAQSHAVTIGKNGTVNGDIFARDLFMSGKAKGRINASGKVHIARTAEFEGVISSRGISVEDGAFLKATIELVRENVNRQQASPHRVEALVFGTDEALTLAQAPCLAQSPLGPN